MSNNVEVGTKQMQSRHESDMAALILREYKERDVKADHIGNLLMTHELVALSEVCIVAKSPNGI